MASQAEFLKDIRAAVDHLYVHRKILRKVSVRIGFWPQGMVINLHLSTDALGGETQIIDPGRLEVIPWEKLETIDAAELIGIIDRLCAPAHELLLGKPNA